MKQNLTIEELLNTIRNEYKDKLQKEVRKGTASDIARLIDKSIIHPFKETLTIEDFLNYRVSVAELIHHLSKNPTQCSNLFCIEDEFGRYYVFSPEGADKSFSFEFWETEHSLLAKKSLRPYLTHIFEFTDAELNDIEDVEYEEKNIPSDDEDGLPF